MSWLSKIASTCGRAIGTGVHAISDATGKLNKKLFKIPILGGFFHVMWAIGNEPFRTATDIANGKRIDKVVVATFKRQLADTKEVAPYVQTVIAFVPGIGPGVSGAIGAGCALAEGKSVSQIMIAAAAGAVPGGALAQMALTVGADLLSGKKAAQIGVDALIGAAGVVGVQIPPEAQIAIKHGLDFAKKLADGEKLKDAAMDEAITFIPKDQPELIAAAKAARHLADGEKLANVMMQTMPTLIPGLVGRAKDQFSNSLQVGMAFGQGQRMQAITDANTADPALQGKLQDEAKGILATDPLAATARQASGNGVGFDIGLALARKQVSEYALASMRKTLNPPQAKAFDMAISLHAARVTVPPSKAPLRIQVGFFTVQGLQGAPPKVAESVLVQVKAEPEVAKGADLAVAAIAREQKNAADPWIIQALRAVGLHS